jgi:hypothetical protein
MVETWDETIPNNSTNANQIDDKVVSFKVATRERLAVEHCFYEDETGHTDVGEHKQGSARINFGLLANRPANNSNNPGAVYATTDALKQIFYDNGSAWVDITDVSGALADLTIFLTGATGLSGAWNAGQEITATKFIGPLEGNADTATSADDASTLAGASSDTEATTGTIAKRSANGDIKAAFFKPTQGTTIVAVASFSSVSNDTQNDVYDFLTLYLPTAVGSSCLCHGGINVGVTGTPDVRSVYYFTRTSSSVITIYYDNGGAGVTSLGFTNGSGSAAPLGLTITV